VAHSKPPQPPITTTSILTPPPSPLFRSSGRTGCSVKRLSNDRCTEQHSAAAEKVVEETPPSPLRGGGGRGRLKRYGYTCPRRDQQAPVKVRDHATSRHMSRCAITRPAGTGPGGDHATSRHMSRSANAQHQQDERRQEQTGGAYAFLLSAIKSIGAELQRSSAQKSIVN
jgi:hypothetical protein